MDEDILNPEDYLLQSPTDTPDTGYWDQEVIGRRPEIPVAGPIAGFAKNVLGDMQSNPYSGMFGLQGKMIGSIGEAILDPAIKVAQGDPLTRFDVTELAATGPLAAAKSLKAGKDAITRAQLTPDITRRGKVSGQSPSLSGNLFERLGVPTDWYAGGMPANLVMMAEDVIGNSVRRSFSPKAMIDMRDYGMSANVSSDFDRAFKLEDSLLSQYATADTKTKRRIQRDLALNRNEYVSQAKHMIDVLMRRQPDHPLLASEFKRMLYPRTILTNAPRMQATGADVMKVFDGKLPMSTEAALVHISKPAIKSTDVYGRPINLSLSRWNSSIGSDAFNIRSQEKVKEVADVSRGQNKPRFSGALAATNLLKDMPLSIPRTAENVLKWAEENPIKLSGGKTGAKVDVDKLKDSIVEGEGFISFGGRVLGQDRQYANYDWRVIVDQGTGRAYFVQYDEMRLGSGNKMFDRALNPGGQESLGIDFMDAGVIGDGKGANVKDYDFTEAGKAIGMGKADVASNVRATIQKAQSAEPTLLDVAKTYAKTGVRGAPLGYYLFGDDEPDWGDITP